MFKKRLLFVLMVAALIVPALATGGSVGAQETAGLARVRIGYFAFDPYQFDTLIDGELMPGGGWEEGSWLSFYPEQDHPYVIWCCSATPFLNFPSGVHEFAFAPRGEGLDAAIFGPQEVTFEDGHRYSLAVVGKIEDSSLNLLVVDETTAFADADPASSFMAAYVHDMQGAPPVTLRLGSHLGAENLEYGQFTTAWWPGETNSSYLLLSTKNEGRFEQLMSFSTVPLLSGISTLEAIIGSYPGDWGTDYSYVSNWWYVGKQSVIDGGAVAVGDTVAGEIPEVGTRVKYTLTLDSDASLNLYANATGPRTDNDTGMAFDPIIYVSDAQGRTLFWNDEITYKDDSSTDTTLGIFDAGLEGIELAAGVYTIEVGAAVDFVSGPYELIVESAASD